jgi:hypothetical protein
MPYSYHLFKNEILQHFRQTVRPKSKILDVGAGSGTYGHLLIKEFSDITALEIFPNYIQMFNLEELYPKVIVGNILEFDISSYHYVIMGDVIEHLTFPEARKIIDKICSNDIMCLVAVPYMFEQGEEYGNIHETHKQPDLTKEIFLERYPQMNFLVGDEKYGYFVNY